MANEAENKDNETTKREVRNYVKYSSIGFQMIAIIGLFAFIGHKIDSSRNSGTPLCTALFSVIGVCIALYQVIRSLRN